MRADLLHVVTAVANPLRWESRTRLYREFERHMLDSGVHLTTVECAYGERPHELGDNPRVNHVPVRAKSLIWNKENLLNIGIARLPQDWKYVAWIDADVIFRRPTWAADTVHALQIHDVIQPWTHCYDLGPQDQHVQTHRSFGAIWAARQPVVQGPKANASLYEFAHPGYAWAATRRALELLGGLIETAALGAGDHHMALGLAGQADASIHGGCTEGYRRPIMEWQRLALREIAGNVGCIEGTIEHRWHGTKARRAYIERWDVLVKHRFDPATDLRRNTWGVLELAGNKPELRRDMLAYFSQRNEDANAL